MKCVILAAGYATRMYPLTKDFPKPLLKIKDKILLNYLIDDLKSKNYIEEYILVTNDKFICQFTDWKNTRNENITIINDYSTNNDNRLGAVRDIMLAIEKSKIEEDLLIIAADNLLDFSLNAFIEYYYSNNNTTSIMTYKENSKENLSKTGVIVIDDNDIVLNMFEKPKEYISSWAVPPFYIINQHDIKLISSAISEGINVDAPGNLISYMVAKTKIIAFKMPGKRYDIGTIEGYESLNNEFIDFKY